MPKRRKIAEPTAQLEQPIDREDGGEQNDNLKEHPLLNHLVLERIFSRLNAEDLMQMRLVCKTWNTNSLKIWRPRAIVTLGPPTPTNESWPVNQFCRKFRDPNHFLQLAEKPYTRIILKAINFQRCQLFGTTDVPDECINFWNDIGPHITHLDFQGCTFNGDSQTVFENVLKEKLPNLKILQLTGNDASNVTAKRSLIDLNEEERKTVASMGNIRNLKTLKIIGDVPMCPAILLLNSPKIETLLTGGDWNYDLVHIVNEVKLQLDGKPFQLKNLDMMESLTLGRFWNIEQQQKCPLEQLSFNVRITSLVDEENVIHPFVSFYANTLQVLKILRPPVCKVQFGHSPFSFDMPALRELYLFGNITTTFRFLSGMPNLEVLYVDYFCFEKVVLMEKLLPSYIGRPNYIPYRYGICLRNWNFPERPLEKLKIFHFNADIMDMHYRDFAKCMPNLKVLRTMLSHGGLEQVCTSFANLEELVILFKSEATGDITLANPYFNWSMERRDKLVLKKLKRFELCAPCDSTSDCERINDRYVNLFLLRCPNLEYVYASASKYLSKRAEESLRDHAGNVTVIRSRQGDRQHDAKCKLCPLTNAKRRYQLYHRTSAVSV